MHKETSKASEEMYLKTILQLSSKKQPAKTSDISKVLCISPASVTEMIEKLSKKGLVHYSPYHGATLTPKGKKSAKSLIKRYFLLKKFFTQKLGASQKEAHSQSCLLEHFISRKMEKRIAMLIEQRQR